VTTTHPTPEVFIIGGGPVATALAMKLSRAGVPVAAMWARRPEQAAAAGATAGVLGLSGELPAILTESDIVLVAVRDDAIAEVTTEVVKSGRLRKEQVLLHCSGALPAAQALAPARGKVSGLGTMHPLVSFADAHAGAAALRGATIAVEGDDAGREAARALAQALGATAIELPAERLPLYHAAAVIACNYLVALGDAGVELLEKAGFSAEHALAALAPLMASTVRNLGERGAERALTGPIARGDAKAVERHLAVLAESAPDLVALYEEAGRRALAVARRAGDANAKDLDAIDSLLARAPSSPPRPKKRPAASKRAR
jgi:predicted short-subunit dehydrogenase-like oxidoreductase (DUF2520 family)